MKGAPIRITPLQDNGDERGSSFSIAEEWFKFLGSVLDAHIATLQPGHIRGNHYHLERYEMIIVVSGEKWSLYWDSGPETEIQRRQFTSKGAVLIEVEPLASHAIRNEGLADLWIVALSNRRYDPQNPDTYRRPVVQV